MPHMDGFIPVISYWSANRVTPREGRVSRNGKQSCVVVPARMGGVDLTALITHGIINPALCSPYFHINIYTFLHNKSTVCMHDAFFLVIYDYS